MTEITPQEVAAKLLSGGFAQQGPVTEMVSDPIADTPMVVTLDDLRPYELNPRLTRNPLHNEIKTSIRERGLDAPPPITRRPGAGHYIIRNGGNTRLAILRELWSETKEERFFRIHCLFRPWPERGEIVALIGHLAENELHGGLSFVERALGVEKARELYEQEAGNPLSQSELARRLTADGYPTSQPHISRMRETIEHLLPAIPNLLYAGLGRHQVEQLTGLRRAAARVWEERTATAPAEIDFATLFHDMLSGFDDGNDFTFPRVQDELIGHMSEALGAEYDTLAIEMGDAETRWRLLNTAPGATGPSVPITAPPFRLAQEIAAIRAQAAAPAPDPGPLPSPEKTAPLPVPPGMEAPPAGSNEASAMPAQEPAAPPDEPSERLQSIRQLVADRAGVPSSSLAHDALDSVPAPIGGLFPVTDVWHIDPGLESGDRLRIHIAQFAREIANEAGLAEGIVSCDDGMGFYCTREFGQAVVAMKAPLPRAVLTLLYVLGTVRAPFAAMGASSLRLSEDGLVRLFRLLRLAHRLPELGIEADNDDDNGGDAGPQGE